MTAVPFGQQLRNGTISRQNDFNDMNVAMECEPFSRTGQHGAYVGVAYVMQKAVDENKIELAGGVTIVGGYVGYNERLLVLSPRAFDVGRIDVHAEVVGRAEKIGIRSWAASHIQNPPDLAKIIMRKNGQELVRDKRGLPKTVETRLLHQKSEKRIQEVIPETNRPSSLEC